MIVSPMEWDDWVDLPTIRALSQHASATLAALGFFAIVHFARKLVSLSETSRTILEILDEFALVGLFGWLIYQMARLLWECRGRSQDFNGSLLYHFR